MSENNDFANLQTEIAKIRGEFIGINALLTKLDAYTESNREVASDLKKMIAVHDNKIDNHYSMIRQLSDAADKKRTDDDKRHQELLDRFSQIRDDVRTSIHISSKEINEIMDTKFIAVKDEISEMKVELESMKKWRWIVTGGAAVIGFLINWISNLF